MHPQHRQRRRAHDRGRRRQPAGQRDDAVDHHLQPDGRRRGRPLGAQRVVDALVGGEEVVGPHVVGGVDVLVGVGAVLDGRELLGVAVGDHQLVAAAADGDDGVLFVLRGGR